MLNSGKLTALLDANVLYQHLHTDVLLNFAKQKLFTPKWSDKINNEWMGHLAINRPDIEPEKIERRRFMMERAFPNANIQSYTHVEIEAVIPDPDDLHVLQAAVAGNVNIIVSDNEKDFPSGLLKRHGLAFSTPDDFITKIIAINEDATKEVLNQLINHRFKPKRTGKELIEIMKKRGLSGSADAIKQYID